MKLRFVKKRRRVIAKCAACVVLGVVISFGVAWTIENRLFLLDTKTTQIFRVDESRHIQIQHIRGLGHTYTWIHADDGPLARELLSSPFACRRVPIVRDIKNYRIEMEDGFRDSWGWPFRSVYNWGQLQDRVVFPYTHDEYGRAWVGNISIVYLPHWGGLALNTLFYAAVVAPFVFAPNLIRTGRAWRRTKRGQCIQCGYSLEGLTSNVCPECGAP